MHNALKTGNTTAAKLLLLNNADYNNIKDNEGRTALDIAKRFNNYKMNIFNGYFSAVEAMATAEKESKNQYITNDYLKAFKANVLACDSIMRLVEQNEEAAVVEFFIKKAKPYYLKSIEYFKLLSSSEKNNHIATIETIVNQLNKIGIKISIDEPNDTFSPSYFRNESKDSYFHKRNVIERKSLIKSSSFEEEKKLLGTKNV